MGLSSMTFPDALMVQTIITCTIEGILEEEDLAIVASGEKAPKALEEAEDPYNLTRIKERHHSVARMIAGGASQRLTAMTANYTEAYLSILLNSPAMKELVELYRIKNGNAADMVGERLRRVAGKAVEEIERKLDDPEQDVGIFELAAVAKLGYDRSGHGPTSTSKVIEEHHILDHAEIQRLELEARKGSASYIVPMETVRQTLLASPEEIDDNEGN